MASAATNNTTAQPAAYSNEEQPQMMMRNNVEYELTVRQQPKQARMCGVGGKADRRPIDPPPIVQLRVITPTNPSPPPPSSSPGGMQSYLQNPYYFMFASLASPDTDEELHLLKDGKTRCTTGSVVSSLYHLKDSENGGQDAGFFVFPDLSVRTEGSYRLKLTLFEVIGGNVHHCKSIFSKPFYVYTAKKFPGMEESTGLSCSLADQGIKIRIRKDIRVRKRPSRGDEDEDEEDGDDDDAYDDDERRTSGKRGRGDGARGKSGRKNKRQRIANSAANEDAPPQNEWGVIDPSLTSGSQPAAADTTPPDTRTHQPPPPPAPYAHYPPPPHVYAPPPPMPYPPPPPTPGQPPYPADPRGPHPHEGYHRDAYGHYHPPPPPPPSQGYGSPAPPPTWDHYRPPTMPPQQPQYDFGGPPPPPPPPRAYAQPPPPSTPGYSYGHYDAQYQQGAPAPGAPPPRKEGPQPAPAAGAAPPPQNPNPNPPPPGTQPSQYVQPWTQGDAPPPATPTGQRAPYPPLPPPSHPGYAPVHHQQYQHQYAYPPHQHAPPPPPQQDWYGYARPAQGWGPQQPQGQPQPPPPGQQPPPQQQPQGPPPQVASYYDGRGYPPPPPPPQAQPYRDDRAQGSAPAPAPGPPGGPAAASGSDRIELAPLRGSPPRPAREGSASQGQGQGQNSGQQQSYALQGARFEGRYRTGAGAGEEDRAGATGANGKKNPLSIGSIISADHREE